MYVGKGQVGGLLGGGGHGAGSAAAVAAGLLGVVGGKEHPDVVAVLQAIGGHIHVGQHAVDPVHPAGVLPLLQFGEGLVAEGDGGDIAALVPEGQLAVLLEPLEHIVYRGPLWQIGQGGGVHPQGSVAAEGEGDGDGLALGGGDLDGLALAVGAGDGLLGHVDLVIATDHQIGGDGLIIEVRQAGIGGVLGLVALIQLAVAAQGLAGQGAGDGDGLALELPGDQQIFVGHGGGIGGSEAAPGLQLLPAIHGLGHDAGTGHVLHVPHPDQIAVFVFVDLHKGAEVANHVLGIGVAVFDAVPIVGLDLAHQVQLVIDLLPSQGLDFDLKGLLGQHGHGGIVPALAAGAVQDAHRQGDGLGALARSGTIDLRPGGVGHVGGFDDIRITAGDEDGGIFAVEAVAFAVLVQHIPVQVAGDGELDVAGDGVDPVCTGDSITSDILQAAVVEDGVQGVLVFLAVVAGGHLDGEGLVQGEGAGLVAGVGQLEGEGGRQGDGLLRTAAPDHGHIGIKQGVRRGLLLGADGDGGVAALPGDQGPLLAVRHLGQIKVFGDRSGLLLRALDCRDPLQSDLVQDLLRHGVLDLRLVPIHNDGNFTRCGDAVTGEGEGHVVRAEPLGGGVVGVSIEEGHIAVCGNVRAFIRGVGLFHALDGNADLGVVQLGLHHGQHIGVLTIGGIEGVQLRRVDGVVQLLLGSLRFVLGPDGDFKRAVIIDVIVFAVSKLGFQLDLY